jgi:GTP-binding protein EngB required for normal cell division
VRHGEPLDPKFAEARALLDGTLNDLGVAALARVAPPGQPRRFVVRALAPPPVPAGNIYALLSWAEAFAARHAALLPLAVPMARAVEAFDRPLLVAVMGEFNAGKSSFVNALAGAAIAPVGITPTTATVNVLRHGASGGRVIYHDGMARELAASAVTDFLARLADADAALIRQVELFAPVEALRRVEIVDTPGLNSLRAAHEQVARDFLIEADAIVWVFAAGQAAKATEHAALVVADGAGKHVLGVVNKVDRATPSEIAEILGHVRAELGGLVERVLPLSARAALEARRRGDTAALDGSGLTAVEAALESDFFGRARELKRGTALTTLARFVSQARAAIDAAPVEDGSFARIRSAIGGGEQELRSALAAERLALRVRLEAAFRAVAPEVREFIRPRAWLFGEHRADPEDEIFLRDLLDDGALAATERTRATLKAAVPDAEPAVMGLLSDLGVGIDDAVERFRAYVRGIVEGAAAVFFRVDLPRIRLDLTAIRGALGRWSPDPEESLFGPVERLIDTFAARAYSDLDERQQRAEIAALMRREHVLEPLARLADAIAALVGDAACEPSA